MQSLFLSVELQEFCIIEPRGMAKKGPQLRELKDEKDPLKSMKMKTDCFDFQNNLFLMLKQSVFKNPILMGLEAIV
jgi:hypothetical protein